MPCVLFKTNLGTAIVCGRAVKACRSCGHLATKLCDFAVAPGKTCDAPICAECAQHFEPNKDYCPEHRAKEEQQNLPLFVVHGK